MTAVDDGDQVRHAVEGALPFLLGQAEGRFGLAALAAGLRVAQFALDGGDEAGQFVLEDEIVRPGFHGGHGLFVADDA